MRAIVGWLVLIGCGGGETDVVDTDTDVVDTDTDAVDTDTDVVDTDTDVEDTDVPDACAAFAAGSGAAVDEVLGVAAAYRNDRPALAVAADGTPSVLWTVAEGGFHGYFGARSAEGWAWTETPFAVATGGLAADGVGARALTYDGAWNVTLRRWDGAAWSVDDARPDYGGAAPSTVAFGPTGDVFAVLAPRVPGGLEYVRRLDGEWIAHVISDSGQFNSAGAVQVGADGLPRLATWARWGDDARWRVLAIDPDDGSADVAYDPETDAYVDAWIDLAVRGDLPVALVDAQRDGEGREVLALIGDQTPWRAVTLAVGDGEVTCPAPTEGAVCDLTYAEVRPQAVAADADGAWWLWSRDEVTWHAEALCGGPMCMWQGEPPVHNGALYASCVDDSGQTRSRTVAAPWRPGVVDAVTGGGALHLATYDVVDDTGRTAVRYLQVPLR